MISLIEENRERIEEACDRYRVDRLRLFGSAATGQFKPGESDLDFFVKFLDRSPTMEYVNGILGLADALEEILQCPVDLITDGSVRNPYLQKEIQERSEIVYDRSNQKTPA
ncbi:MAG: nucleotidyltransferase domain-containing protein [Candidatus Omnitrophica bacterium]|nr:nucleotidyltransferase domain-containing protein [Candidatus Omnitrophota bacterium]